MNADFSFEIDPSQGLVRITMAGLFTIADVRAFAEARRELMQRSAGRRTAM